MLRPRGRQPLLANLSGPRDRGGTDDREGGAPLLHPGFVLRQANLVLRNRFLLPAWIHVASRITFHAAMHTGSAFEVRAIPEEKWQRKGHEFVRLYVAIRSGVQVTAEIVHTAIFRPRQ